MPTRPPTARLIPQLRRAALAADTGPTDGALLGEFIRAADADAFAALVRRHGPMVLGVCRRVVGEPHTADDAFQAVWLVLVRRAASVRPREQVANFLFGVAYRTALKARAGIARRRLKEAQVDPMPHPEVAPPDAWPDLLPVIDAELARLPDKHRLPVVLCDLEGRPQREVARQLGVPPATLANRLASARRTLARRLAERGVTLSGGALATAVTANAAQAVPPALAAAAERIGLVAAGGALAGTVPAHVVQLSEGVIRMMVLSKLKTAVVAALVGVLATAGAVPVFADDSQPAPKADGKPALGPTLNDDEFLRRVCLDLRGTAPTTAEAGYFAADKDAGKRKKVVGWLTDPEPTVTGVFKWNLARLDDSLTYIDPVAPGVDGNWSLYLRLANDPDRAVLNEWFAQPNTNYDAEVQTWLGAHKLYSASDDGAVRVWNAAAPSDEDFLKKACQEARGAAPTRLEREYFLADKDPKKREKLLDLMLKDPAVAQKVGPDWKQKMLNPPAQLYTLYRRQLAAKYLLNVNRSVDRFDGLLGQLLDGRRPPEQVLDALSAGVLGRLPTESERKLILANVAKAADKPAAWREVVGTLSGTDEARQHADALKARTAPKK